MGIFGTLFNSGETLGKVTDAVIDTGDAMFLTKEEEIQYNIKKQAQKMEWMKLYEPFKIAQRYLALIVSIPYVLGWFITFIVSFFISIETQLELLKGDIGMAFILIVGFYFAGGMAEGVVSKFIGGRKNGS